MSKKVLFAAAATAALTTSALGLNGASAASRTSADTPQPSKQAAVQRATSSIGAHRAALRATSDDTFTARDVVVDADGSSHVRMDRTVGGLKVLGGDTVVHTDGRGAWRGASLTLKSPVTISRTPRLTAASAKAKAPALAKASKPTLVIEARQGAPRLAYLFTVGGVQEDGTPSRIATTVDANTGRVLLREQQIHTAEGDGKSLYRGTVPVQSSATSSGFELKDTTRGNALTKDVNGGTDLPLLCPLLSIGCATGPTFTDADNHWGTGTTADRASAAVDVQFGTAATWDYYKQEHGRNGIFNDGKGVPSRVHYGNAYVNAFWDGKQMTYGDGDNKVAGPLVSLDVAAHEMSHGVMSATANLTYSGESGGLNESSSDIFGALVENKNSNADDPGDWFVGEEIVKDRPALRFMDKPSKDGQSPDCYISGIGDLDVHYSSGVGNHFAYLLANGSGAKIINGVQHNSPTCNGSAVTGIGNEKLGKIWYRAISVYMTSSTNYVGARTATLSAAKDLYGASSPESSAVAAAWSAVGVA
ncbi:M4 family metallopeptidase [Luteipulveratus mongoliensis]|uniref:Neutral metalloproteinase n=1 Tax=Luteipulveratus mongoliensis TaxID=571913 RepID=A0A0K1JF59_9MICO|nr:M4 family metallopeptidase [Luteipulveratus mongoliensis]AKU15220.1 peptidase [Luteipulveratus mongoliensis]